MKKLLILLCFGATAMAQKKDSLKIDRRTDSLMTLKTISEISSFMKDYNVGVKDYILFQNILSAYYSQKFIKPKK